MSKKLLLVCGHGVWLQMATALVARHLQPFGYQCLALELPTSSPDPASTACGPELETVCQMLGLPLAVLLQQAGASYSLGCRYQQNSRDWFVPFGDYAIADGSAPFMRAMPALLQQQPELSADAFSVAALAARQGKFALAPANRPDLQAALRCGLHVSSREFAACLQGYNQQLGVSVLAGQSMQLQYDAAGYINAVQLDDGRHLQPDFLLDCRRAADNEAAASHSVISAWQAPLHSAEPYSIEPYSSAMHTPWGWLVKQPLQYGCHWQIEVLGDSQPLPQIQQQLTQLTGLQHWQVKAQPRQQQDSPWRHNHLRWGQAAATLDCPLYNGLAALQYLVVRWLDLFTTPRHSVATSMLYNQHWQQYQHEVQQFLLLHQQPMDTSAGLVFARLGRLPVTETDAIKPAQWLGLLCGLGLTPALPCMTLTNSTAGNSTQSVQHNLHRISQQMQQLVAGMPRYKETLSRCLQSLPD